MTSEYERPGGKRGNSLRNAVVTGGGDLGKRESDAYIGTAKDT